ncbi:MAG: IS1 family transposase [Ketobacter sp.]|nr:IS1 family transposase [Ketobacter sp.]
MNCPYCSSTHTQVHCTYPTKNHGPRRLYECKDCFAYFSETKNTLLEDLKTPLSVIWQVLQARTDGLGLNATARTFGIAKNTVLDWERRCADLQPVLFLYSLTHQFLQVVIEGDEAYTKVEKNRPADQSEGWTLLLMDRASRFIWTLECGKKDRKLFEQAIGTLEQIVQESEDLTLLTDGERRYGNLLFSICWELIRNGKPGRPKKTLKKGVKVRIKNKGSQAHKKGPKRPKYQAPWNEHPDTEPGVEEKQIHANHAEAFFSALRRKSSPFRRKTNTYAKSTKGLQRLLDVYWVVHNFIRIHYTTREVPAVALGVIERRLSVSELFQIRRA